MAWTAPRTWSAGELVTAALLNTHVRDNLLVTGVAKVTTAGDLTYATAANVVARLALGTRGQTLVSGASAPEWSSGPSVSIDDTGRTTASTSYVALTGAPSVTITTGTKAIMWITARMSNNGGSNRSWLSCAVSSATTIAASDAVSVEIDNTNAGEETRLGMAHIYTLTAGSNVFTLNARVAAGTGTFENQSLIVGAL